MDYPTFTRTTAERAGLPEETVERIEHPTLRIVADRISGGEAQDLAAQLPARLQDDLRPPREDPEVFGVDEFVRRVTARGGVGPDEAAGAAAVLITVRDAVTPGEFDDLLSRLPQEYRELVRPMS
jgi:uncharacterized protein (DUF2267 family)